MIFMNNNKISVKKRLIFSGKRFDIYFFSFSINASFPPVRFPNLLYGIAYLSLQMMKQNLVELLI